MGSRGTSRGSAGSAVAVVAGVTVVSAVLVAPQFALSPTALGASVLLGAPLGAAAAVAGHRYKPSPAFVALAVPLLALAVWRALAVPGVSRPAVLVAAAACAVAGTVTDHLTTR